MPWQKHRHKSYYTRSVRVDGRVVTEYLGRARAAALASQADAQAAADHAERLARARADQALYDELKQTLDEYDEIVRMFTTAALLVNGYHLHKRQWRKKRVPSKPNK